MPRVLIVDDSKTIQRGVKATVEALGAQVVGLGNDGEEGLALFREHTPDLVLLDITMPNKDGRECLRDILNGHANANVVMLSALNAPEVIEECLRLGARAFIDKSCLAEPEKLAAEISRYLKPNAA